ncbi:DUF3141 domain-containing protein [Stappia sp. F7233]|uniref:DUF3141 domain-containing protein n=1 Tax=Stappia albiluteola TaxID=2758565 RepID=A0A839A983_9HYPH|nr:DUF3141 domain-containing protein [Stappia albiluteola]MBA5775512.1 DUF3141 domain-containing protein [Stappia albiluteola]
MASANPSRQSKRPTASRLAADQETSPLPAHQVSQPVLPGPTVQAPTKPFLLDLVERTVLFLDVLRERADNMIAHERQGMPPLLDFKYETILDARHFETPANYALLRITEVGDDCWDDCVDPGKAPVIVVDPRAGHGPGIGGFKRDSEVGMALHEGHAVYFVVFFPEPMSGQTLADVHHALRRFVAEVARRHPSLPPVLYGNCQAGWAVTLLAADCVGLTGPVVLNGSPLSYWAGVADVHPMRVMGALTGGAWAAHMVADLGDGRFDGAWLAQNFENLQPEKAIWEKYASLFTHVDTEAERFLDFERWWNGFYTLSREEILEITENLFIGNQLESGEMHICEDCSVDLRRIRNSMVVFASVGDNITPPEQALGWIARLYPDSAALKEAGKRIVYLINPHIGHLGIFVSASIARLEHRAILESLDEIEALAPGLYEMKIDNPSGDPDCHKPGFAVRFEAREVSDLGISPAGSELQRVAQSSRLGDATYDLLWGPWIRALTTPASAAALRLLHPMRWSRLMFSERYNPWMGAIRAVAEAIRPNRVPLPNSDPRLRAERALIETTSAAIGDWRRARDAGMALTFRALYGNGFGVIAPKDKERVIMWWLTEN